jgi:hypothetical protein
MIAEATPRTDYTEHDALFRLIATAFSAMSVATNGLSEKRRNLRDVVASGEDASDINMNRCSSFEKNLQ